MDPTISLDEAFSRSMGLEELGTATGLPRGVVTHVRDPFSVTSNMPDSAMKKLKLGWARSPRCLPCSILEYPFVFFVGAPFKNYGYDFYALLAQRV